MTRVRLRVRPGFRVEHREADGWRTVRAGSLFRTTPRDAARLVDQGIAEPARWWSRG